MEEIKETKKETVPKVAVSKPKKAEYKFIQRFATASKVYNVGDECFQTDKKVIEYLTTKKIIKKWQ
jgi:hypothetical protein